MRYFSEFRDGPTTRTEVTKEEALRKVTGSFCDNETVRSWLTYPNCIPCAFSVVYVLPDEVKEEYFNLLLLAGIATSEDEALIL